MSLRKNTKGKKENNTSINMKTIPCRLSTVGPSPQMWAKSTWHISLVNDDKMDATPARVACGCVQMRIVKHGSAWSDVD